MKVVEQFVRSKSGDPSLCEDVLFINDDFAVVIDGATDKTNRKYDGMFGGRFAAELVASVFSVLDPEIDLSNCVKALTDKLRAALRKTDPALNPEVDDGPCAVLVAYSVSRREVWRIGDCSWATQVAAHLGSKTLDRVASEARAGLLRGLLLAGASEDSLLSTDPGRDFILPLLRIQYLFRNLVSADPFIYGAIDGSIIPELLCETWPVATGQEIVLASDGYPMLFDSLARTEAYLASDLRRDPLRIRKYPSTKAVVPGNESFDDRAYLRILT